MSVNYNINVPVTRFVDSIGNTDIKLFLVLFSLDASGGIVGTNVSC